MAAIREGESRAMGQIPPLDVGFSLVFFDVLVAAISKNRHGTNY